MKIYVGFSEATQSKEEEQSEKELLEKERQAFYVSFCSAIEERRKKIKLSSFRNPKKAKVVV